MLPSIYNFSPIFDMVFKICKVKNRGFLNFVVVVVVVVLIVVLVVVDLFCPRYSDYTERYTTIIHSSFDLYNWGDCNRPG